MFCWWIHRPETLDFFIQFKGLETHIIFESCLLVREERYGQRVVRCGHCAGPKSIVELSKRRGKPSELQTEEFGSQKKKKLYLTVDLLLSNLGISSGTPSQRYKR